MSLRAAYDAFEQFLTGVGIDENGIVRMITGESRIVDMLVNFDANEYRVMSSNFKHDQLLGYIWKEKKRRSIKLEFQCIVNAMMLWMTTPIERDARLLRSALKIGDDAGISVLIEIVCTRPFSSIFVIRCLYGQLFNSDLLFDLGQYVPREAARCLINLFGMERRQEILKVENKCFHKDILAFQNAISEEPQTDVCIDHIVNILTLRSIGHLQKMYKLCKPDRTVQPKFSLWISKTFLCLVDPVEYFYQVLFDSLPELVTDPDDHQDEDSLTCIEDDHQDENSLTCIEDDHQDENSLTCIEDDHQDEASLHIFDSINRIIITRRGIDLHEINTKFIVSNELSLQDKIKLYCKGTYQKLLLKLSLDVNILGSEAKSSAPSDVVPTQVDSDA